MQKGLLALLLGIALLGATLLWGHARALSCIGPVDEFERYDLVVRGRVASVRPVSAPAPEQGPTASEDRWLLRLPPGTGFRKSEVTLEVDRYFRGSGPETVTFVYTWGGYRAVPFAGVDVYIGMKAGDGNYWADECSLIIHPTTRDPLEQAILKRLHETYGEGRPPVQPLRGHALLWGAMGTLAAVVFTAYARRRTA